ncbi:uncharacterized protein PV09_02813 [Verruconis gallopava]|uniref:ER-bound oxygenase mpaB/mpaB'/Rubber oxygenase catalytic domain-containing protein n=1 Tax=Verruconis gallopava TaxID=253628 RepID=A0A0D1XUC6_9PEZI|nr:uncharacterized protein PV09_02813 [Verruconis gallopava]KIW06351.1 hypothetical protein PV09_02813 [Verruconis gallopava]
MIAPKISKGMSPVKLTVWDYTFELTDEHPTPEVMNPMKFTYDKLGEDCYRRLNDISPPNNGVLPRLSSSQSTQNNNKGEHKPHRDLYQILKDNRESDPVLGEFWRQVSTVPDWVDWDQIARGQDVFYRYGAANLTGLTYQSLLGGMGAGRVVETLARTGGFNTKVARRRLFETTQHILQVTKSLEAIQPLGEGWASTIRVRLLHSAVRERIMKLASQRPSYYNVEKFGIPINDLDSIGTIGTFSASLVWISLPRQGIYLREQEIKDYFALWRYVAYVIGTPDEVFADQAVTRRWMHSLLLYEVQPTDMSGVLAGNIIKCLQGIPPLYTSKEMLTASARWLNGDTLCDKLGLERPSKYYTFLMAGQCVFYMFLAYSNRLSRDWDQKHIAFLRKAFWAMIVEHKNGLEGKQTVFDMKYIPDFNTLTDGNESDELKTHTGEIERRNLRWMLMAIGGMLGISLVSAKIISVAFKSLSS